MGNKDVQICSNSDFNMSNSFSSFLLKKIELLHVFKFSTKLKIEETSKLCVWLHNCSFTVFTEVLRIRCIVRAKQNKFQKNNSIDIIFEDLSH